MSDILAEVITEAVGERCPDFEPDCIGCQAWAEYDRVKQLEAENARLREELKKAQQAPAKGPWVVRQPWPVDSDPWL